MDHDGTGVVLCYPYGQEYIRCHMLYVHMANKLAKRGFHALRFDYYGTGDSAGDFSSVTVKESLDNIQMAIDELKKTYDVSRIILFGVRFGATLAVIYSRLHAIDALVLWDPVLDGRFYLKSIDQSYKNWLKGAFAKRKKKNNSFIENFGFQFSMELVNEIRAVNIGREKWMTDIPTLVLGANSEYWIKREDEFNKAMVPVYETDKTIDWLDNLLL
ncbi:hypothetical protein GCM10011511_55120 [Puia dinghuensis]|uniref:Serine aminopeptidase S33 domain-containing protein n=2 Tax=Puia dinghuensis TaxID=1792502 RepID=A0A8J2XXM8_9BACT|nr:hypothetical protein GCM10011511_55120 [Puia dinghuensis]